MAHSFPRVQEGKRRTILLYLKKTTSHMRWKIGLPPQKVRMECKQSSNNCINSSEIEKQCQKVRDLLIQQLHSSQWETGELRGKVAHSRPQLIETDLDPQAQTPSSFFLLNHEVISRALHTFYLDDPSDLYPPLSPLHPPLPQGLHCNEWMSRTWMIWTYMYQILIQGELLPTTAIQTGLAWE